MTILFDARRSVNPGRPFGAGVLPPDEPPTLRPDRPFEPSPEDWAWWAAESARLDAARAATRSRRNRRRADRPAWHFSRTDRLRALIERARETETYLNRERCDARPADRPALDARRAALAARLRRLYDAARDARRLDRHLDELAAESAALDAVCAGFIPADPPAPRRPGNPVTDRDLARVGAVG